MDIQILTVSRLILFFLLSSLDLFAIDLTLQDARLSSVVNGVRDTAVFGDLRSTAISRGSSSARATYDALYTISSFRFAVTSHTLTLKDGEVAVLNEGKIRFQLNESAFYSISGSNVWSGATRENGSAQASLSKVNSDGTLSIIYLERDSLLATAGGFGFDSVAQGDPDLRIISGTNNGFLFPGTYQLDYSFSLSDQLQDHTDNAQLNGWFDLVVQSERASVADPLTKVLGYSVDASGGDRPWTATLVTSHDNGDAARSGAIANSQNSFFRIGAPPGLLSFWWKVSSQTNVDFLQVSINGRIVRQISGTVDWQQVTLTVPLAAFGVSEVKWTYTKGLNGSAGEDAGWVDAIKVSTSGTGIPPPPQLSQTIDFQSPQNLEVITSPTELVASASSGLPVSFSVFSGPAFVHGSIVIPSGTGQVTVRAVQNGDSVYLPAAPIDRVIQVSGSAPKPLAADTPEMNILVGDPDARMVESIVATPDGKIVVGGYFGYINGQRRFNIARFNADASLDQDWIPQIDGRGVFEMVVRSNALFVAGQFQNVNGVPRTSLAKISLGAKAVLDPVWNPGVNDIVFSIAATDDGLIAAGGFTGVKSSPQKFLAKFRFDGAGARDNLWWPSPNMQVYQVSAFGTNVYLYGAFTEVDSTSSPYLAKVSGAGRGAIDTRWRPNLPKQDVVGPGLTTLLAAADGLYLGGFPAFGPPPSRYALAKFSNVDGATLSFGYFDKMVTAVALHGDALYVGYGDDANHPLASHALDKVSAATFERDPGWNTSIISKNFFAGSPGKVSAIAFKDNDMYVGGDFRSLAGSPGSGLAFIPAFGGSPLVTNATTSVNQLTSTGVIILPNPQDEAKTKFFKVSDIQHGTLYDLRLNPIANNGLVSLVDARLGLRFLPDSGFFGQASFNVRAVAGSEDSAAESAPATAVINVLEKRYSQSITFQFLSDVPLNAGTLQLHATASSGLPVSFTVLGPAFFITQDTLQLLGVGEVQVYARQPGNEIYESSLTVGQTFHIKPNSQIIYFGAITNAVVNRPIKLGAQASSGLPIAYEIISGPGFLSGDMLAFSAQGIVVVRAAQPGNELFAPAASVEQTIVVGPPEQVITFPPVAPRAFNSGPLALNASASSGLPITYKLVSGNADLQNGFLYPKGAGYVVVEASQPGNEAFSPASAVETIYFARAIQSISYDPIPHDVVVGQQYKVIAGCSSGLPVIISLASGVAQLAGDILTITTTGTLRLLYSAPGNNDYEPAEVTSDVIRASAADQTISWRSLNDVMFDLGSIALDATASSGLPVSYKVLLGPATVSNNRLVFQGTGIVQLQAFQLGNSLYKATDGITQAFYILKGRQEILFDTLTNLIAGENYSLTASASSGLPITFAVLSGPATVVAGNQLSVSAAGTLTVVARQDGNSNYYAAEISQVVNSSKRAQSITFSPIPNQRWNSGPVALEAHASSGLPLEYQLVSGLGTLTGNSFQPVGPGPVTIRAVQAGNETYETVSSVQSFLLEKGVQILKLPALPNMRLSDGPVEVLIESTAALVPELSLVSGPAILSNRFVIPVGVGTVTIRASQPGSDLYEAAIPVDGSFLISQGVQSITFLPPGTMQFGTKIELTAHADSGLPIEFGILSGPGILSNTFLIPVELGDITIVAMQTGSTNFEAAVPEERVVTVLKGGQTIQFDLPETIPISGQPVTLNAIASSGLPVRYLVLSGPATLSGNALAVVGPGTVKIRAFQPGDRLFEPAPNIDRTVTFTRPQPSLAIERGQAFITLSWPAGFSDYHVERTPSLRLPSWSALTLPVDTKADSINLKVPSSNGAGFYRLVGN